MSIVAIISSPEKNGNTDVIVSAMVKAAEENGQTVKTFYLNPMGNKKGCQACMACKAKGRCVQKDDLTAPIDAIREADGIILSSPVYFGDSCGQYRMLEDRFFSYLDGSFNLNMPAGKKVAVVTAAGSARADTLADKIAGIMSGFFKCQIIGKIAVTTSNDRDYAKNNKAVLDEAVAVAKKF